MNRTASRGVVGAVNPACPFGCVNAERVHARVTVLGYVEHAASHWTVMRKLISESGGWGNADEAQKALQGQLGKQKQSLEMRIANYVKAVGDGRMSDALLAALDKAEAEKQAVCVQMEAAEQQIRAATLKRPTTGQVQEAWGNVGRVWPVLTEEERADLLATLVQTVEVTDKEKVTLELLPIPMSPSLLYSHRFGLSTPNGSGKPNNYHIQPPLP